jgi:ATP-dependent RNA helicase DDX55/SPB4
MTDADALSDLVRAGLRNPARIVVKVQSKKVKTISSSDNSKAVEERRTPARFLKFLLLFKAWDLTFRHSQLAELLHQLQIFREVDPANAHNFT